MNAQLTFNFKEKDNCPSCNDVFGNQTWSIINDGDVFEYCSVECLDENHDRTIPDMSLDFLKN